jgi:hypothetical protein
MENQTVVVNYKTQKGFCSCCNQKLPEPKTSKIRKFEFSKDTCLEWLSQENWQVEAEDKDELQRIVEEFVYETIGFFATSSDDSIIIENSDLDKVKQFVLKEVISA